MEINNSDMIFASVPQNSKNKDDERIEKILSNGISNSVNTKRNKIPPELANKTYIKDPKKFKRAILIGAGVTVAVGVALGSLINTFSNFLEKEERINDVLEPYSQIVINEKSRTQDNKGYWYDYYDIAKDVLKSDNVDLALYGVFCEFKNDTWAGKLAPGHMDKVLQDMSDFVKSEPEKYPGLEAYATIDNMDAYLTSKGFVNSKGEPSVKDYESKMDSYALGLSHLNMSNAVSANEEAVSARK